MTVAVKICGVNSAAAVDAALAGGARYVGFVFYPPSPRAVSGGEAAALASRVSAAVGKVGLFVDAPDPQIEAVLAAVPLDMLQLHGSEPPDRIAQLRRRFGLPVMKAVKIATEADLEAVPTLAVASDWLLFDAKPPKERKDALPGGNAMSFDWRLLAGRRWPRPWMLSGGLRPDNLAEAVAATGARVVDVSSGVEDAPGRKSPAKIAAFLRIASELRHQP